jgi:hypothetical protein
MAEENHIHYLTREQLDEAKWNQCIDQADNGLIYASTTYLDTMARHWDALVLKDHEAVFPLTWNRKWGIHYLYQPFLTAQLGLFGKNIDASLLEKFLQHIPRKFRYWDIYLNHGNVFPLRHFETYLRTNYVLDLRPSYDTLVQAYRENIVRNIRRAAQSGCQATKGVEVEQVISLAVQQMNTYSPESKENVDRFRKLYALLHSQQQALTYGILSSQGQLLSSAVFFISQRRAYYILVGNHPDGRTVGASHALIDAFIKDHAGKDLILDFEGSDLRNLAFFYSSFGAKEENFAALKLNRLPVYLRWLKK